jgi:SAM-dependent methyltransferase
METQPPVTSFTAIADFYDELMKPVGYRMWVSYYLLLLSLQEIKPKAILDMCCGTGTMTDLLSREGFHVEGFDLAEDMIRVACEKAERRKAPLRFEIANATTVDMGRQYDAVFCFFDSLNNVTEDGDLEKCFERAAAHLPSGGSFIFDLNLAYAFEAKMFNQSDLSKKSRIRYRWRGEWNELTRRIRVHMKFWVNDQIFEEFHEQRAYEIDEVVDMLHRAGFHELRVFHSYTLEIPRPKTDRVHFTCIKV